MCHVCFGGERREGKREGGLLNTYNTLYATTSQHTPTHPHTHNALSTIASPAESNATCGKRLDSIGVANTEDNRRAYRELLVAAPGLGSVRTCVRVHTFTPVLRSGRVLSPLG